MASPFVLSIEDREGHSFQHGYHLGTQEPLAREIAEDCFETRLALELPTVTVALMKDGKVFDVFDGTWSSDR